MIWIIIIVLAVILVGLLVDWKAVLAKLPKNDKVRVPHLNKKEMAPTEDLPEDFLAASIAAMPVKKGEPEQKTGDPELDKMLEDADAHFRRSEIKAAEQLYLQVAARAPKCSKAYSRLGVIYLENGEEWDDAEAAFRQALKYDRDNGYILNNLGLVLYHQDKFADAIRNFEHAVHQDDLNASRHSNLGMAYMAMRQYAKAESSFKKALKLAPHELEYKDLLAEALEKRLAHNTMVRR